MGLHVYVASVPNTFSKKRRSIYMYMSTIAFVRNLNVNFMPEKFLFKLKHPHKYIYESVCVYKHFYMSLPVYLSRYRCV